MLLPVANRPRTEATVELPSQGAGPESTGEPPGSTSARQLAEFDDSFTEMFDRIELTQSPAIQTSEDLWPDRIKASPDIPSYVHWHENVRPGGEAHPPNGLVSNLSIQARSVKELSQTLITMLDHYHRSQMGFPVLDGVQHEPIGSLQAFFQPLRCYFM